MDVITGPVFTILLIAVDLYMWVVIIGVVLSWLVAFNVVNTSNKFVYTVGDFCYRATEPLLGRIRRLLPNLGGLDISPVLLILALIFLKEFIFRLSYKLA
ncbi:MAG: YggT family protein [Rhodospirillaceae bacterium]